MNFLLTQLYIGPQVSSFLSGKLCECAVNYSYRESMAQVPKIFQPYFWSAPKQSWDLNEDRYTIIHQIFSLGDMPSIRKLKKIYPRRVLRREFLKGCRGQYDKRALQFSKLMLGLEKAKIDQKKYIKIV